MPVTMYAAVGGLWIPLSGGATGGNPPPSNGAFPDATTTGVPLGTTMQRVPEDVSSGAGWSWNTGGWVTISGDETLFSSFIVNAEVVVQNATGVIVDKCRITTFGTGDFGVSVRHANNTTIRDCEISGTRINGGVDATGNGRLQFAIKDVYGDAVGTQILRCNMWDTANTISMTQGLIDSCFIHNMGFVNAIDHVDCIIADGAQGLTITGNTIFNENDQTACVALYGQTGPTNNVLVSGNLLGGGGYVLYGGSQQQPGTNVRIINNQISSRFYPNGGNFGVLTALGATTAGNAFTGNTWADGPNAGLAVT